MAGFNFGFGKGLTGLKGIGSKIAIKVGKSVKEAYKGIKAKDFGKVIEGLKKRSTLKSIKELKTTTGKLAAFPMGLAGSVGGMVGGIFKFMDYLEVLQPVLDVINGLFDIFSAKLMEKLMPSFMKLFDVLLSPTVMKILDILAEILGVILTSAIEGLIEALEYIIPALMPILEVLSEMGQLWEIIGKVLATVILIGLIPLAVIILIIGNIIVIIIGVIYTFGLAITSLIYIFTWGTVNLVDAWNATMGVFTASSFEGLGHFNAMMGGLIGGLGAGVASVWMAEGGIVTQPTLAVIGEAGPEAVVPLDQYGGGGDTINVHLEGGVYTTGIDELASKVARKIDLYKW